jgi:hypothetical protein
LNTDRVYYFSALLVLLTRLTLDPRERFLPLVEITEGPIRCGIAYETAFTTLLRITALICHGETAGFFNPAVYLRGTACYLSGQSADNAPRIVSLIDDANCFAAVVSASESIKALHKNDR